jgi:hypothetical protein
MANIINLTAEIVTVITIEGEGVSFLPSGQIAEVETFRKLRGEILVYGTEDDGDEFPIFLPRYVNTVRGVKGLPEQADGVCYIVSTPVRNALPNRFDLLSPGLDVLNGNGIAYACKGLDCNYTVA